MRRAAVGVLRFCRRSAGNCRAVVPRPGGGRAGGRTGESWLGSWRTRGWLWLRPERQRQLCAGHVKVKVPSSAGAHAARRARSGSMIGSLMNLSNQESQDSLFYPVVDTSFFTFTLKVPCAARSHGTRLRALG
jgi:hypothetical protein